MNIRVLASFTHTCDCCEDAHTRTQRWFQVSKSVKSRNAAPTRAVADAGTADKTCVVDVDTVDKNTDTVATKTNNPVATTTNDTVDAVAATVGENMESVTETPDVDIIVNEAPTTSGAPDAGPHVSADGDLVASSSKSK